MFSGSQSKTEEKRCAVRESVPRHSVDDHVVVVAVKHEKSCGDELPRKINDKNEFFELFESFDKENVVVTFLSILEMTKNKEITLSQKDNFSPIMIESVK